MTVFSGVCSLVLTFFTARTAGGLYPRLKKRYI